MLLSLKPMSHVISPYSIKKNGHVAVPIHDISKSMESFVYAMVHAWLQNSCFDYMFIHPIQMCVFDSSLNPAQRNQRHMHYIDIKNYKRYFQLSS